MTVRVFLLDDHEVVRRGLRELLGGEEDIEVVGEADSAATALVLIGSVRPDVAVLDVRLPDGSGIDVCRDIRSQFPTVACLILTSFDDDDALLSAVLAGASGYVLKQVKGGDLLGAIREVASGGSLLDPRLTARVLERLQARPSPYGVPGLTEQERRVLELIGEGLTNRQIGARMHLAEKTIKNYVSNLFGKLGMSRRSEAAAYAARLAERSHA